MSETPRPDPALLELFRTELDTHLATLNEGLLSLEKEPNQPKCVEALMRAAHSIKGAAKIVGFTEAVQVAHVMEDCFVAAQAGQIQLVSNAVDVLLRGVDALGRLGTPEETPDALNKPDESALERLLEELSALRKGQTPSPKPILDKADAAAIFSPATAPALGLPEKQQTGIFGRTDTTLDEFVSEAKEHLTGMVEDLLGLEKGKGGSDGRHIDRLFRAVHSVKGGAGFFGCRVIETLAHAMEEVLEELRQRDVAAPESSVVDLLLAGTDRLMALLDDVQRSNDANVTELLQRLTALAAVIDTPSVSQFEAAASIAPPTSQIAPTGVSLPKEAERAASIRVPVPLVDRLMTLAGELVLARNQALRSIDGGAAAMQPVLQRLDAVTSELQGAVTQTRMQPVGSLFAKFPRLVRDLARQLDKTIDLEVSGIEVELDKSVLELLSDPLTHLVRNCCDHGIELPAERQRSGKPPTGKVSLSAQQLGSQICIEVRDDGRGLDPQRIKRKSLQTGLRTEADLARMTERELLGLILLPGFSTAKEVTDVSGRGVGMDVVKTNLDQLGGSLEIESSPGAGAVFSLRVPLTLAIIPCLIVTAGGQRYAIPQKDLEELVCLHEKLTATQIESSVDQEVVRLRDRLLPLVRLTEVFGQSLPFDAERRRAIVQKYHGSELPVPQAANSQSPRPANTSKADFTLFAVVKVGSRRFGLIVDEILKSEEIVVKPMHGSLRPLTCFSGTTIMGDGRTALILNIEGIARHAGVRYSDALESKITSTDRNHTDDSTVLLFTYGPQEQFAVPLAMLRRLVMVERERIERVGTQEFITLDGVSVPILRLDRYLPVSPCDETGMLFLLLPKNLLRPMGLLATSIIDTEAIPANFTRNAFQADGVVGTSVVRNHMTLFLDMHRLEELANSAEQLHPTKSPANSKARILLVEDTQFFRELIQGYLESEGYEIAFAVNGAEALLQLENEKFDLVVSDIEMPVMDGWALALAMRQNPSFSGLPLLALTTLNSAESRDRARHCGFDGYQVKLDRNEFLAAVAELLQTHVDSISGPGARED
jgi:two-component system, chemotaxis family, sensor kinase CheA